MTGKEYMDSLLRVYRIVSVLRDKPEQKIYRLRHRKTEHDLILRSFPRKHDAYEILCAVSCENLPEIYDVIQVADGQIVLEEYIDGITVEQVMQTGKYCYRGARKVLCQVCNGLAVLHSRGIIHRDVKPENVMIGKDGRVVLIDFDAARQVSQNSKDTMVMGTVGYAAPEQLGVCQTDGRTDVYGVGVLLNVMLTGNHPSQTLAAGRAGRIVKKCTAINPDDRYQTAYKLCEAL